MAIDKVEQAFRAQMRALAHKGGAVTKRRYGNDPNYYRDIGRLGGSASAVARRARVAAELEVASPGKAPIVEPFAPLPEAPPVHARPVMTLSQVLADLESRDTCSPDASNRRKSPTDAQAERDLARFIAHIRQGHAVKGVMLYPTHAERDNRHDIAFEATLLPAHECHYDGSTQSMVTGWRARDPCSAARCCNRLAVPMTAQPDCPIAGRAIPRDALRFPRPLLRRSALSIVGLMQATTGWFRMT